MPITNLELRKAKEGDIEALERILKELEPSIQTICKKFFLKWGGDRDDLMQEARLALIKAVSDFNSKHGVTFENFATRVCVTRRLYTLITSTQKKNSDPLNQSITIDSPIGPSPDETGNLKLVDVIAGGDNPEDVILQEEESEERRQSLYRDLTELEASVLGSYEDGYSYREIAKELRKTEKCVDNALTRIRKKARKK